MSKLELGLFRGRGGADIDYRLCEGHLEGKVQDRDGHTNENRVQGQVVQKGGSDRQ